MLVVKWLRIDIVSNQEDDAKRFLKMNPRIKVIKWNSKKKKKTQNYIPVKKMERCQLKGGISTEPRRMVPMGLAEGGCQKTVIDF